MRYNSVQAAIEKERLEKQQQKLQEKNKEPGNMSKNQIKYIFLNHIFLIIFLF